MDEPWFPLALALASYEMDEPHWDRALFGEGGEEARPHYPDVAEATFREWLAMEHCGDCVGLPASCPRCYAEAIRHKATWIIGQMSGIPDGEE